MSDREEASKSRRVLFVMGSGISLISGAPDVRRLTEQILSADRELIPRWFQGVGGDEEVCSILSFLKLLKDEHERSGEEANYEDLFSLCQKLYEHEVGMATDGSIIRFRDHIYRESAHLWRFYKDGGYLGEAPLGAIAGRATFLIADCLKTILNSFRNPQGLNLVTETVKALGAKSVDVVTLNHDRLLEYHLGANDVEYTCGFDPSTNRDGEVDFFDETAFISANKVRVIKLHGSCEWLRLRKKVSEETTLWRWGLANETAEWHEYLKDADGNHLADSSFERSILTGSTTKTTAYTRGIFGDLYIEARKLMREHDTIICSGYGWKDDGFNWMIKEWAERDLGRRLILLHDRERDDFENRKPWLWPDGWRWGNPLGWLNWHPRWLSDTSFSDIENYITNTQTNA